MGAPDEAMAAADISTDTMAAAAPPPTDVDMEPRPGSKRPGVDELDSTAVLESSEIAPKGHVLESADHFGPVSVARPALPTWQSQSLALKFGLLGLQRTVPPTDSVSVSSGEFPDVAESMGEARPFGIAK